MKFNWGMGITLFYSLFMMTMIYMVYQSTQVNRNLVAENYYEKDLQYQSHLDRLSNSARLKTDLAIFQNKEGNYLRFVFPKELTSINGDILFYRPSDNSKDFNQAIELDEAHEFRIPTSALLKGAWKIKINWEGDETLFYKEASIQI